MWQKKLHVPRNKQKRKLPATLTFVQWGLMGKTSVLSKRIVLVVGWIVGIFVLNSSWGQGWQGRGPWFNDVGLLAVDSRDHGVAFLGLFPTGLLKTTDGGQTWSVTGLQNVRVDQLAIGSASSAVAYAVTDQGVFKSADRGQTWASLLSVGSSVRYVTIHPLASNIVWAAQSDQLIRSDDGAKTWRIVLTLRDSQTVGQILIDPVNPRRMWFASQLGIYRSLDGGDNWSNVGTDLANHTVFDLVLAPGNGNVLYATAESGVYKSETAGASWRLLGLNAPGVVGFAFDATAPDTVYVGVERRGVMLSTDGGVLWQPFNDGLAVERIAGFGRDVDGNMFAASSRNGVSRRNVGATQWQNVSPEVVLATINTLAAYAGPQGRRWLAGTNSGLYMSDDLGAHWHYHYSGLDLDSVVALVAAAGSPAVLYAATANGAYKSNDAGETWRTLTVNAPGLRPLALAGDPAAASTLLAGTANGVRLTVNAGSTWRDLGLSDKEITAVAISSLDPLTYYAGTSAGAVFKSSDRGLTWTALAASLSGAQVSTIWVDAKKTGVVYLGTLGPAGAVYVSRDGGATWEAANDGLGVGSVSQLLGDAQGTVLHAATANGVFRSIDRATTWTSLSDGLPNSEVFAIAMDGAPDALLAAPRASGVLAGSFPFTPAAEEQAPAAPAVVADSGNGGSGRLDGSLLALLGVATWLRRRRILSLQ